MGLALLPRGEEEENNKMEGGGGVTTGVKDLCSVTARHKTLLYNLLYIFVLYF